MKAAQFEAAVRMALNRVPFETRRAWNGNDLFAWWMETSAAHPDLIEDGYKGDLWQRVHALCRYAHLFGADAV